MSKCGKFLVCLKGFSYWSSNGKQVEPKSKSDDEAQEVEKAIENNKSKGKTIVKEEQKVDAKTSDKPKSKMFDMDMLRQYAKEKKQQSASKKNAEEYAIFKKNYPNVVSDGEVGSYSCFQLDRKVLDSVFQSLKKGEVPNTVIRPQEVKDFKYASFRQTENPNKAFDYPQHKSEYNKIGDFVEQHIQRQMKEVYGLKEVFIPEDDQISDDDSGAKNNIFMSHHFYRPDEAQQKENSEKTALVLI